MRPNAAAFLAFLSLCLALAHPCASAATRAALLGWESVPAREDMRRVAGDLLALAQVELSTEPDLAWMERAELEKLVAIGAPTDRARHTIDNMPDLKDAERARLRALLTPR